MQPLASGLHDAGHQRLANQFVRKFKGRLRILGGENDQSHPLRFFDRAQQFIGVIGFQQRLEDFQAKAAPGHRRRGQDPLALAPSRWILRPSTNLTLAGTSISSISKSVAKIPGVIEDLPFLDQVLEHLLDEKWIALGFIEDQPHQ